MNRSVADKAVEIYLVCLPLMLVDCRKLVCSGLLCTFLVWYGLICSPSMCPYAVRVIWAVSSLNINSAPRLLDRLYFRVYYHSRCRHKMGFKFSFFVMLTLRLDIIVSRKASLMHNLFSAYSVNVYTFREYLGPSSGGTTVCTQHLVLIIIFRWNSIQPGQQTFI